MKHFKALAWTVLETAALIVTALAWFLLMLAIVIMESPAPGP